MATILTPEQVADLRIRVADLRSYTVRFHIVPDVDNQGTQCEYCGDVGNLVAANVYMTDWSGDTHCADTCLRCVVYVIDGHVDTDPDVTVTVEVAQGAK